MGEWLERYRVYLFLGLMAALLTGVLLLQLRRPEAASPITDSLTPAPSAEATETPRPLRVYVSGAVNSPDVYSVPLDSIAKDALLAAGGPTQNADLDRINLAAPLSDGEHVYVPTLGEESPPVRSLSGIPVVGKININTASSTELEELPGIGPALAQRIVDHRETNGPFVDTEDIVNVSGIGPATYEKLKDLITAR
ncbi:helix-hairpin-helix domain-containing protein [Chloroflexota bacterium]